MSLEIGQPEAVDVDLLDDAMDNQQSVPDDVEMNEGGEDEDMKMLDDGDEENNNNDQEMEEVVVADGDGDEPLLEEDMETRSDVPEHEKEHKQPPDDEPEVLEDEEEHKQPPNDEGGPEVVEVFDTEEGEGDTEEPAGVVEEPSSGVDRGTLESENEHVQVLSGNEQEDHFESLEVTGSVVVDEIETAEKQEQEPEIAEGGDDHQETDAVGTSQQRSGDKQPAEEAGSSGAQEQAENTQQQESAKEEAVDQLEDESAAEEVAEEAPEQTNETETKVAAAVNEDDNDNAETGDQATAAATSEEVIEEEEGAIQLDFPIIVFRNDALYYLFDNDSKVLTDEPLEGLLHDTSHCETSIEALFSTLREVFDAKGDPLKIESELVFSFPQLGLVLSEDNCYAKDITLYDIVQVFLSLNDGTPEEQRPTHLEVELNEQQRFITTFNYLSDIIKEGKGFNDIEFEEHDDTEQGEDEEESAVDENGNNNVNEDDDNGNAHNAVDTGTSNGDVSTPQKTAQGDDGENESTTTNEHSPSKKRSRQEDQVDELETPSIGDVLGDDDENSNTQQEQPVVKRSKPDQSTAATAGKNSI